MSKSLKAARKAKARKQSKPFVIVAVYGKVVVRNGKAVSK